MLSPMQMKKLLLQVLIGGTAVMATVPSAPSTAPVASNPTLSTLDLNWGAATGALAMEYQLEYKKEGAVSYTQSGWQPTTFKQLTSLESSAKYFFQVQARDQAVPSDVSVYNNQNTFGWTKPNTPNQPTVVSTTSTQITVNWNAVSAGTSVNYIVFTKIAGGSYVSQGTQSGNSYTTPNTLAPSKQYYFKVQAVNDGAQNSGESTELLTYTQPTAVAGVGIVSSNVQQNQFTLSWTALSGQDNINYRVLYGTASNSLSSSTAYTASNTQTISGLSAATQYFYKIETKNTQFSGIYSVTYSALTSAAVNTPSGLSVTGQTTNQISVSYATEVNREYEVSYQVSGGSWTTLALVSSSTSTQTISGLSANTQYSIRLRARDTTNSLYSGYANFANTYTDPAQPSAPSVSSQTANSITVQISTAANLEYAFSYKQSGGAYTTSAYQTSNTFQRTSLTANTQYVFKVQARRQGTSVVSTESSEFNVWTKPATPTLTASSRTDTQLVFTWTQLANTENYVELQSGINWNPSGAQTSGTYTLNSLTAQTQYNVRMRERYSSSSLFSDYYQASFYTNPAQPATPTISSFHDTQVVLSWTQVAGNEYQVSYSTASGSGFTSNSGWLNAGTHTQANLNPTTTYYFKITAKTTASQLSSVDSAEISQVTATLPPASASLTSSAQTDTTITLSWTGTTGSMYQYSVEYKLDGGAYAQTGGWQTATTYTMSGLAASSKYLFKVMTKNNNSGNSASAYSNELAQWTYPAVPGAPTITSFTDNQIVFSWTQLANHQYHLFYKVDGAASYTDSGKLNAATFTATGLTVSSRYYAKLKAVHDVSNLETAFSSEVNQWTKPAQPATPTLTQKNDVYLAITWTSVANAQYKIEYKKTADASYNAPSAYQNANTYNVNNLDHSTSYDFRVTARDQTSSLESIASAVFTQTTDANPAQPTGLAEDTASRTDTQLKVNWSGHTATNIRFIVSHRDVTNAGPWVDSAQLNALTYTATGLTAQVNYEFKVKATNTVSTNSGTETSAVSLYTNPAAVTGLTTTSATNNQITVSWTAVAGNQYWVQYKLSGAASWTDAAAWINTNTYTATGLTAIRQYIFQVKAKTTASTHEGAYSSTNTFWTSPAAPSGVSASGQTDTTVPVSWNAVSGATDYQVSYSTDSFATTSTSSWVSGTSTTLTGLTSSTAYKLKVTARANSVISPSSSEVSVTTLLSPPGAPTLATVSTTQIDLTWTAVVGATDYKVFYKWHTGNYIDLGWQGNVQALTVPGLIAGTEYTFKLKVKNAAGTESAEGPEAITHTQPAAPTLSIGAVTHNQIDIYWTALPQNSATATIQYVVESKEASGAYAAETAQSSTSFSKTGLLPNKRYFFKVKAQFGSIVGAYSTTNAQWTRLNTVAGLSVTAQTVTTIDLTWTADSDATDYDVEYKLASSVGAFTKVSVGSATNTYQITGLSSSNSYKVKVSSKNADTDSVPSSEIDAYTVADVPAGLSSTSQTDTSITLSWSAVSGTNVQYQVSYAVFGSALAPQSWQSGTTYTQSALLTNTQYSFTVTAKNNAGAGFTGSASSQVNQWTKLTTPTALSQSAETDTSITVTFNSVAPATSYDISYKTVGGSYTLSNEATNTKTFTGLTSNTQYVFKVQAKNTDTASVDSAEQNIYTKPSQVTGLTSTARAQTTVDLSWTAVTGSNVQYKVQHSLAGAASWTDSLMQSGTTYQVTGLTAGTQYDFQVTASNSVSSKVGTTSTIHQRYTIIAVPSAPTQSSITTTQIDLTWASVTGATSYKLSYKLNTDLAYNTRPGGILTTDSITGLTEGKLYNFKVEASNPDSSAESTVVNFNTKPIAPTLSSASHTATTVSLSWLALAGDSIEYQLESKTGANSFATIMSWGTSTTYQATGLTQNTAYVYQVKARSGTSEGAYSTQVTQLTNFAAPTVTVTSYTHDEIQYSWNAIAGASEYIVSFNQNGVAATTTTQVGTTLTKNTLLAQTDYEIQVRANSPAGTVNDGDLSTMLSQQTKPALLVLTSATQTETTVVLSWTALSTNQYQIAYKVDGAGSFTDDSWTATNVATKTMSGLVTGTKYIFKIRSRKASNPSVVSVDSLEYTFYTVPLAVTGFTYSNLLDQSVQLSWNTVVGTSILYQVEYKKNCEAVYSYNQDVSTLTHSLTLIPGTLYYVKVTPKNAAHTAASHVEINFYSPYSSSAGLALPKNIERTAQTATSATIQWTPVAGANHYVISTRPKTGGDWCNLPDISAPSFTGIKTGLAAFTKYDFRVSTKVGSQISDPATVEIITSPNPPTGLIETGKTSNSMMVGWTPIVGEHVAYKVSYKAAGAFTTWQYTTWSQTSPITIGSLSAGTTYSVMVRAKNIFGTQGGESIDSAAISVTLPATPAAPPTPTGLTASSVTQTAITLTWNDVFSNYDQFVLQMKDCTAANSLWQDQVLDVLTYTYTNLTPDNAYCFQIKSRNTGGDSAASTLVNQRTVTPVPTQPQSLVLVNKDVTMIKIDWADVAYAKKWNIRFGGQTLSNQVLASTEYQFDNLAHSTSYTFEVQAINSQNVVGPWSVALVQSTNVPPAPITVQNLYYARKTQNSVDLTWDVDPSARTYEVQYRLYTSNVNSYQTQVATTGSYSIWDGTMIVNTHRNLAVSTKYMAHTLTGLATNTKYKVKVVSVNVAGVRSAATSEFVVETNYGTAQPTTSNANLRQKSNWAQSIELEWNTQPNNVLYRVHLYDISSRVYQSATVSATNYQFTGLQINRNYRAYLSLVKDGSEGPITGPTHVTTTAIQVPMAPRNAQVKTRSTNSVTFRWEAPADNGGDAVTHYDVMFRKEGVKPWGKKEVKYNANEVTFDGLAENTAYQFYVIATNSNGESADSAVVKSTTKVSAEVASEGDEDGATVAIVIIVVIIVLVIAIGTTVTLLILRDQSKPKQTQQPSPKPGQPRGQDYIVAPGTERANTADPETQPERAEQPAAVNNSQLIGDAPQNDLELVNRTSIKVAPEKPQAEAPGQIQEEVEIVTKPAEQKPAQEHDPTPATGQTGTKGGRTKLMINLADDFKRQIEIARKIEISRKIPTTNLRKDDLEDEAPEGESSMA